MRTNGKKILNLMMAVLITMASLSAILFVSGFASAGPIVVITITGQNSGTAIENGIPDDDVLFDVLIENNGDAVATINLSIIGTPGLWNSSLTGTDFTISAGSSQTEILTIHIYCEALESSSASLTVKDTTNNRQDTCRVNVDQVYGLVFETANTIHSSLPNSIVSVNLPINNTGNGIDTTTFEDTGAPESWSVSYDASKNIPAFDDAVLAVSIYIPEDAESGTSSIILTGTSEDTITYTTKTLTITVLAEYGVMVSILPSASLEVNPGGRASYTLQVTNIGNAQDRFDLSVDNKTNGWTATLGTQTTPQVGSNSHYNVTMHVRAPINAQDTDMGYVNVSVSSQANASQAETAYTITTILQERYLSLSVDNSSVTGAQQSVAIFNFSVTNSGNCQDRVDVTALPPNGWSSPNISPIFFILGAGDSSDFSVQQSIPSGALHQGYVLDVTATSRDEVNATTTTSVTVDVEQEFGVQLNIPGSNSQDVNPGASVTYSFNVKNTGNGEDTFIISQEGIPVGWSWVLSDNSVTVGSDMQEEVNLTITVPGDYGEFGPLEVELIATSEGDGSVEDNSSQVIINVQKSYDVILSCNNRFKSGNPEEIINYSIIITNEGNAQDIIELTIDAGDYSDWASINNSLFTIPANSNTEAILSIEIPANQPAGQYYVNITATSQGADNQGQDASDGLTTRTTVDPEYEIYMFSDGGNIAEVEAGDSVTYYLGVQNRGLDMDTIDMSFGGDSPFTSWVSMDYENYTIIDLGQNEIRRLSFDVTIPQNVHDQYPGITTGTVNITGTSRGEALVKYTLGFHTTIKAEFGATLSTENDYNSTMPGSFATYTLSMKNIGSAAQDTFGIEETDCEFDDVFISPSIVEVNNSETVLITITVNVDEDAIKGTHYFNVTTRSAGEDGILVGSDDVVATIRLELKVLQTYDIRATCSQRTKEVAPGSFVIYEVEIENRGNGEDTFDIHKYSANTTHLGWANINVSSVTLARDEVVVIEMNITVPSTTEPMDVFMFINITSRENETTAVSLETISTVTQKFAIRLSSNDLNKETDPGVMVQFIIDVKNDGTGLDIFELSIESEGTAGAQSSWAEIPSAYLSFSLQANQIKRITLNVTPPVDQAVGDYTVTLIAESQRDLETTLQDITATVHVKPKRDLDLELVEDRKEVVPSLSGQEATVEFSLKVINKGTDTDVFKLVVLGSPYSDHPSWVRLSTRTISSLAADGEKTITVTIEIPNNELPTGSDGFNTVIKVTSPGESGTGDDVSMSINLTTIINPAFGIELSSSNERKETPLATPLNYRLVEFLFTVDNIGTNLDTVKLEVTEFPVGWNDVTLNVSTLTLTKGEKVDVSLSVKVEREVAVGDYDITIKVTSRGDDSLYEDGIDVSEEIEFTVEVTTINEIKLSSTQSIKEQNPGSTVIYTIKIENKGNVQTDVSLTLPNAIVDWLSTRTISPSSLTLDAKGGASSSAEATLTIKLSSDYSEALVDTYVTTVTAIAGEGDEEYETTFNVTTLITEEFGLNLKSMDWDISKEMASIANPAPEVVEFLFQVENKGNGPDRYELELSGDYAKWARFYNNLNSMTTPVLDADGSMYVTVNITLNVNEAADFEEYKAGDYDIELKATSQGDETKVMTATLTLTIEEGYYVTLTSYSGVDSVTFNPADSSKSTQTFKIDVENLGNCDDTVKFTVKESPEDWDVTFNPTSRKISLGTVEIIELDIIPDSEVEEGQYTIKLRAQTGDGEYFTYTLIVNIQLPVLELNKPTFEESISMGKETTITVTIENIGLSDAEDITVIFYDNNKQIGTKTISLLGAGESEVIEFEDWASEKITQGKHTIKVSVINQPSGEKEEKSATVEVEKASGFIDNFQGGVLYTVLGLGALVVILLLMVIGLFSRTKKSISDEMKDELAKAAADTMEESDDPEEEEEGEKVTSKSESEMKALPESTKEEEKGEEKGGDGDGEEKKEGTKTKGAKTKGAKKSGKKVRIKCPKCTEIQTVSSTKRPLEFECETCGMKLVLKK